MPDEGFNKENPQWRTANVKILQGGQKKLTVAELYIIRIIGTKGK